MPFTEATLFLVARDDGSLRDWYAQQYVVSPGDGSHLPGAVTARDAPETSFTLAGTQEVQPGGLPLPVHTAFNVFYDATADAGTTKSFYVSLDRAGFDALVPAVRDALLDAILSGGHVILNLQDGAVTEALTLQLRAMKTTNFLLDNSGVANPAFHPGVTGDNVPLSGGETLSSDYALSCPDLGGALSVSDSGAITLASPTAPADANSKNMELTIHDNTRNVDSLMAIDVHVPTDCVVMLDRSGSMNAAVPTTGSNKWGAARDAANLFAQLFGTTLPLLSDPSGNLVAQNRIALGLFYRVSGDQTPITDFVSADMPPNYGLETPSGGTPLGPAVVAAFNHLDAAAGSVGGLGPSPWRRRHIVLLTDGMHNGGGPALSDITAVNTDGAVDTANGDLPNTQVPSRGVTLHCLSYALTGDTPEADLNDLADDFNGQYHHSTEASAPLDPDDLRDMFIDVLSEMLPVERSTVTLASEHEIPVEDGIERVVFLSTDPAASLSVSGATVGAVTGIDASDTNFSWKIVDRPQPDLYSIGGAAAGSRVMALYDHALRVQSGVTRSGLGQPIKIWAQIKHYGEPVTQGRVTVQVERPGESAGEALTAFARSGKLAGRVARRAAHPGLIAAFGVARSPSAGLSSKRLPASALAAPALDQKSLRRTLLDALASARQRGLLRAQQDLELTHVGGGRYEGEVTGTEFEGLYHFKLRAEGTTRAGHPFERARRLSCVLEPTPAADRTIGILQAGLQQHGLVPWTATVMPVSVTGKPLGPGLGHLLAFQHTKKAPNQPRLATVDNLDGTYSVQFSLKEGAKPGVALAYGSLSKRRGSRSTVLPISPAKRGVHQVTVVLESIKILDDQDPWFFGDGEFAFDALVAPNATASRAVRTRLPEKGIVQIASGQTLKLEQEIYQGLLEAGSILDISLGATEIDLFLCLTRREQLARYHRRVAIEGPGETLLQPHDERDDPEALQDWEVRLRVKVEQPR